MQPTKHHSHTNPPRSTPQPRHHRAHLPHPIRLRHPHPTRRRMTTRRRPRHPTPRRGPPRPRPPPPQDALRPELIQHRVQHHIWRGHTIPPPPGHISRAHVHRLNTRLRRAILHTRPQTTRNHPASHVRQPHMQLLGRPKHRHRPRPRCRSHASPPGFTTVSGRRHRARAIRTPSMSRAPMTFLARTNSSTRTTVLSARNRTSAPVSTA
jgi:hypothetical protein